MRSKRAAKKSKKRADFSPDAFSPDALMQDASIAENLRVDAWEAEWENIKQDMELYPTNNVQKALLDVLEKKLYARWLIAYNSRKSEDDFQNANDTEYFIIREELPKEEAKACQDELSMYRHKLECRFGIMFSMTFSVLTFLPLFFLSLIWSVQYQPLIYLLLISAITVIYFTPPFERRGEDLLRCYAVSLIVTIYWFVNASDMLFRTMAYLWLFTTFYYFVLHTAIWALINTVKNAFDPFGYAYLLTIKNLK